MNSSKACTVCGEVKPLSDYHNDIVAKSGKKSACKICVTDYAKTMRRLLKTRKTEVMKYKYSRKDLFNAHFTGYSVTKFQMFLASRKLRSMDMDREEFLKRARSWVKKQELKRA